MSAGVCKPSAGGGPGAGGGRAVGGVRAAGIRGGDRGGVQRSAAGRRGVVGVLDVYRAVPGPLSQALLPVLEVYAQAATAVLLMLTDSGGRPAGAAELAELADIRPVVHQATGMIAVQLDVDLTTALLRLRAHAFHAGRPMQHLAVDVVARRLTLDHSTTGAQHHRAPAPDAPVPDPSDFKQRNRDEHP